MLDSLSPRRRDLVALALVIAAAAGVAITSLVIVIRTERLRTAITAESEGLRALTDSLALAVAEQTIHLQAFLAASDSSDLHAYREARERSDGLVVRLHGAALEFGPIATRTSGTALGIVEGWHRSHDRHLGAAFPPSGPAPHLDDHETRALDLLAILFDLNSIARLRGVERRASIREVYRLGAALTGLMCLVAIGAAFFAYRFRRDLDARTLEARERARETERALRERQEILAIVSHDLRNSLSAISGALSLVREVGLTPERKGLQLEVAARATGTMHRLISDLLDTASIEAGRLAVSRHPLDVAEPVGESVAAWSAEARRKGVRLSCTLPEGGVRIDADHDRIVQVLGNLVGNAIKFTPEGGSVRIAAERIDGAVRFSVEDTGPGIPESHLPRIFERFYQVRASGRAGAGLGLAIARGIVEAHGSRLDVETRPGTGTRFWFDLPSLGEIAEGGPSSTGAGGVGGGELQDSPARLNFP